MKVCSKCKIEKDLNQFSKDKYKKNGLCSWCKACAKAHSKEYYQENVEQRKACGKGHRQENPGYYKDYSKKWRQNNRDKFKVYGKNFRRDNRGKCAAYTRKRKAVKLQRTPRWLTPKQEQQIVDFYINCPKGMVVDHIIPLQGKYVSGLHHPDNLQYLTKLDNESKGNRCPEIDDKFVS